MSEREAAICWAAGGCWPVQPLDVQVQVARWERREEINRTNVDAQALGRTGRASRTTERRNRLPFAAGETPAMAGLLPRHCSLSRGRKILARGWTVVGWGKEGQKFRPCFYTGSYAKKC